MTASTKIWQRSETFLFLFITLLGLWQGKITVFYIIYFFWFQEIIRTVVDLFYLLAKTPTLLKKWQEIRMAFSAFFLLFIYLVFIVVLFGVMLDFKKTEALRENILIIVFRNWFFNANIILFLIQYIIFRYYNQNELQSLPTFGKRHIIIHISIIFGAILQMLIVPRLPIDQNQWMSVLVVIPFLLLKIYLDRDGEISTTETKQ